MNEQILLGYLTDVAGLREDNVVMLKEKSGMDGNVNN